MPLVTNCGRSQRASSPTYTSFKSIINNDDIRFKTKFEQQLLSVSFWLAFNRNIWMLLLCTILITEIFTYHLHTANYSHFQLLVAMSDDVLLDCCKVLNQHPISVATPSCSKENVSVKMYDRRNMQHISWIQLRSRTFFSWPFRKIRHNKVEELRKLNPTTSLRKSQIWF
jgi:hypothetical protein